MTEREWLASEDPERLVRFLTVRLPRAKGILASERKLRLFAVALSQARHPNGYWEGHGKHDRAVYAYAEALAEGQTPQKSADYAPYCQGLASLARDSARQAAEEVAQHAAHDGSGVATTLLREIVGNPFQSVSLCGDYVTQAGPAPDCAACKRILQWDGDTVANMAQAIYRERAYDRFPVLADALEEAGCESEPLLGHLRGPGAHARGCWALDLVLGKE